MEPTEILFFVNCTAIKWNSAHEHDYQPVSSDGCCSGILVKAVRLQAVKPDLDTSWECFMYDKSELSCWNFYNGSQWVLWFSIVRYRRFIWNKYWFANRSQSDFGGWMWKLYVSAVSDGCFFFSLYFAGVFKKKNTLEIILIIMH